MKIGADFPNRKHGCNTNIVGFKSCNIVEDVKNTQIIKMITSVVVHQGTFGLNLGV